MDRKVLSCQAYVIEEKIISEYCPTEMQFFFNKFNECVDAGILNGDKEFCDMWHSNRISSMEDKEFYEKFPGDVKKVIIPNVYRALRFLFDIFKYKTNLQLNIYYIDQPEDIFTEVDDLLFIVENAVEYTEPAKKMIKYIRTQTWCEPG